MLEKLQKDVQTLRAERSMALRRGEPTTELDNQIADLKRQIESLNTTVADRSQAARFASDEPAVTDGQLFVNDLAVMARIGEKNWS